NANGESARSNEALEVMGGIFPPNVPIGFSLTFKPTPAISAVLGDQTRGTGRYPGAANRGAVSEVTSNVTGSLVRAWGYFDATSQVGASAKLVVYTSVNGAPGALVGSSSGGVVPSGGGKVDLGAISGQVVAGTKYFVGLVT